MTNSNESSDWREIPAVRQPSVYISLRFTQDRLVLTATYNQQGEARSQVLWTTTVERPPAKSLAECVEAALYRVARAGADGLLVPSGWDKV